LRILHLFSDWKWTGPAEPMLQLLLAQRAAGHDARLACPEAPAGNRGLAARARTAGVELALSLERARGANPWRDRADLVQLRAWLAEVRPELVHAWHTRDHVLAWRAKDAEAALVRSVPRADRIARWPWNRWLFGRATDGLLLPSRASAAANESLCSGPVAGLLGAVDVERFAPGPPDPAVRAALGLAPEHRVIGIVARVQRHRRFDLLLEAMRRLTRHDPLARLLIVGRGTHLEEVARRPAAELGISDRVVFAGYRGADYRDVLRSIDVFTFLVPGSDGGCRALLEAQACGLPAVTSRRGALPEIIADGETGELVAEDPNALSSAWRRLLEDPERHASWSHAARSRATKRFTRDRLASEVEALYRASAEHAGDTRARRRW
jgi:glycosyltransferase involved in cell wall biosynthesis